MGGACFGWGGLALKATGSRSLLTREEHAAWAMVVGMGVLGWVAFPANLLFGANIWAAVVVTGIGLALLPLTVRQMTRHADERPQAVIPQPSHRAATGLLWAIIAGVTLIDLGTAFLPPADADSNAYHFGLPKEMLTSGSLTFVPRAVEGAIPLLLHMTYLTVLALKGEAALTAWCWLSAWLLPLTVYAVARRHLEQPWALALLIAVKTLPAVVYGSPGGQIEVRLAALFLVALFTTVRSREQDTLGPVILAGMMAGICAAAKYSGLVAPAVCGLVLVGVRRRDLTRMAAFGIAALVAGGQWYLWNGIHTGDPVFPLLWGIVPYSAGAHWDAGMAAAAAVSFQNELAVPRSLSWLLAYPLKATFDGMPVFESARTGFGPLPILSAVYALAAGVHYRSRIRTHEFFPVVLVCLAGYALWFLMGSSQRVRHFMPYLIPLLLVMTAAAKAAADHWPDLRKPLIGGMALSIAIQLGGVLVYSAGNIRHLLSGSGREAYLVRNIAAYPLAQWLNANLGPHDKVMLSMRELIFLIDVPTHYAPPAFDGRVHQVDPYPSPAAFLGQIKALGITHVVLGNMAASQPSLRHRPRADMESLALSLIEDGCATVAAKVRTPPLLQSRTLHLVSDKDKEDVVHYVLALTDQGCRL